MGRADLPRIERFQFHLIGNGADAKFSGYGFTGELDPWAVEFEARSRDGRIIITRLVIEFALDPTADLRSTEPEYPPHGISSKVLSKLRIGQLTTAISVAADRALRQLLDGPPSHDPEQQAALEEARNALSDITTGSTPHRRGNPGHPPAYLRRVAEVRLAVEAEGVRPINEAVAARLGLNTPGLASDHVNAATKAGWLAPGDPGRQARAAGPRLLAEQHREQHAEKAKGSGGEL